MDVFSHFRLCCLVHASGETKRALETRIGEHQAAVRRGETEKSAVADHAWTKQHNLNHCFVDLRDECKSIFDPQTHFCVGYIVSISDNSD